MDTVKKIFPFSFKEKSTLGSLIVNILIQVVIGAIASVLIAVLAKIPVVGIIVGLLGGIVDLYFVVGIIFSILHYLGIVK